MESIILQDWVHLELWVEHGEKRSQFKMESPKTIM